MKSSLVVYARAAGKLLEFEELAVDERDEALRRRFEREVQYRTHGRYFGVIAR